MRNTLIALTLGLCSLPSLAATLAEQFTLMEKGADSALDTRLFSHDGVDIKAWIDGTPVIIAVPIMNEQGKQEGESRYYFKGGKLFGVKEPAAQFAFDDNGKLTRWLDDKGQPAEFVSKMSMQQREAWLTKRSAELGALFAASPAEEKADKGGVKLKGAELAHWLCNGKLMTLAGGDKVTFEQGKLKTTAEGIEGEVSLRGEKGWQDLCLTCEVQGNRVTRLTWQPLPGANKPQ
ncbi:hypothetical protein DRM94_07180 [Aeromonas taiwanensis]|jgi:hypothetical protein|uniref:DUF1481 domain-containing protein n=1 Tax=Aeromonas taiwanensis TaxID=633417 RepID=A0A5F0KCK6_9GAMM|nr:hypothetical protein [Aeromonas taiwanensis]TFF77818.1 hypothetical protein DRM93_07180 [Aeromonas taiwanensis]TFF78271.1 hypothetical protein DRM95_07920 [Aeromonas taiwanensis]TFF82084.1 hypothetical protein DRM94_07180 [Aeromonas taiwanensis]